jgi:hypothetical protein
MIFEIVVDIWPLMIILVVAVMGSALAFTINLPSSSTFGYNDHVLGVMWPALQVWLFVLGQPSVEDFSGSSFAIFFVFSFFVVIVLLNLLIAVMGDSYEKVKEVEVIEDLRSRAKLIVDVERRFDIAVLDEARYVHIAEVVDDGVIELPAEWEGVSGKVKQEVDRVKADVAAVKDDVAAIATCLKQVAEKLDQKLDGLNDKINLLGIEHTAARISRAAHLPADSDGVNSNQC